MGRPFKLQLQRPICSRDVAQEIVIYSVTVRPYKFRSNNRLATIAKNKFDTRFSRADSRGIDAAEGYEGGMMMEEGDGVVIARGVEMICGASDSDF